MQKVKIDLTTKWNLLDSFFDVVDKTAEKLKDSISNEEPDAEYMITVQTEYLSKENERLKRLQIPRRLNRKPDNENYFCPCCTNEISHILINNYRIKFCPECGQRIYFNFATRSREVSTDYKKGE